MSPIPAGSTVVVTGGNGFIASHLVDQLLARGYAVRATVRSISRSTWLVDFMKKRHPAATLELVEVPDTTVDGALDKALEGASGLALVATDASFSPDPNVTVKDVISMTIKALESASKVPSLKRVVLTSSSRAIHMPSHEKPYTVSPNNWNEEAIEKAWAPPPYEPSRGFYVYSASKAQGEKAAWDFVKEKKPAFEFSAVLPDVNIGEIFDPKNQGGSTTGWVRDFVKGNTAFFASMHPMFFVNVDDVATLHVAALVDPDVKDQRILAYNQAFVFNDILDVAAKLRPDLKLPPKFAQDSLANQKDLGTIEGHDKVTELLKKHKDATWTDFETSIAQALKNLD